MKEPTRTGFFDEKGIPIYVGDLLVSEDGYSITVCQHDNGKEFYGSLNCEIGHSCRNIPYALNNGRGYLKVNGYPNWAEDNDE